MPPQRPASMASSLNMSMDEDIKPKKEGGDLSVYKGKAYLFI